MTVLSTEEQAIIDIVGEFVDRVESDRTAAEIEVDRWECVESFVRERAADDERLRVQITPDDDTYIRQRIIESVYPVVDVVSSGETATLVVDVVPGDDPAADCRGLVMAVERP